ncbi:MAG: hypothetical protein QF464_00015 [Myxococcota bacterium]|nr:hypothetical protein [Myxococcota bacterium]
MPRSATFIAALSAFLGGLFAGCYDGSATCRYELACANQEGLIATCCADDIEMVVEDGFCDDDAFLNAESCEGAGHGWTDGRQIPTTSCWYETPDGTTFACDPIEDDMNAGAYCAQAVEDMTVHCSD